MNIETEYWKNRLNNLDFLPLENVRQHFHDMAKYEKIPPKEREILRSLGQN